MFKFLKYDFKGSYKTLLGFILGGIIGSTFIQIFFFQQSNTLKASGLDMPVALKGIITIASALVIVSVVIGFIIYSVRMFSNELNEDRGYLTFSVPQSMYKMILSKLFIVFIWSMLSMLVGFYYNIAFSYLIFDSGQAAEVLMESFSGFSDIIRNIFITGVEATFIMSVCYFAISLSKVTFNNKKLGLLWIPIFILLLIAVNYLRSFLASPYIFRPIGPVVNIFGVYYDYNIWKVVIFDIICGALFVTGTTYILDKKINI